MFPLLLAVVATKPIVTFVIAAIFIAVLIAVLPRILPLDASIWLVVKVVIVLAFLLWALQLFGVI